MVTTLETPKNIFCGNNNMMQSGNSKQDHPGQENYKQPYKVIYPMLFTMAFVHSIKYIFLLFLGNYPGWIDEKMSTHMTVQVNII